MRLLVIGGTVFLGRHIVSLALSAGHQVTTLNRGTHYLEEQENVEKLIADRDGDLSVLAGRTFDAVIDTCGYRPESVAHSVRALAGSVGRYVFISTISVYGEFTAIGIGEEHPIKHTPQGEPGDYGTLKADCETVVQELMGERALIVRPGLIVGPYDPTDRFTYWPARFARGGKIAVPEKLDYTVQFIDVRDLAQFILKLTQEQANGLYIATGPQERTTMEAFLDACESGVGNREFELVKVDEAILDRHGIAPWTELPLWIPSTKKSFAGIMRIDRRKAVEAGLTCRPIVATIRDTLSWDQTRDPAAPRQAGLSEEKEALLLREPRKKLIPGKGPHPGEGVR